MPSDISQLLYQGNLLNQSGKFREAIEIYEKAIAADNGSYEAWMGKSFAYEALGLLEDSLKCYNCLLEEQPFNPQAWYKKGIILSKLEQYEKAIVSYDSAIALRYTPEFHVLNNKACALFQLGRQAEALTCVIDALTINPNDEIAWNNKGHFLQVMGKFQEAIICFLNALAINKTMCIALFNMGLALHNLNRYDEAIYYFDQVLTIDENNEEAWSNKGAELALLGKYDDAIICLDKALSLKSDNPVSWCNKGIALVGNNKLEAALKCYERVIEIDPEYNRVWAGKGLILFRLKQYNQAIDCFDKEISANSNNEADLNYKGNSFLELGNLKEALECYNKALEINDKDQDIWNNKGHVLDLLNDNEAALLCFDAALALNSNDALFWNNKGCALSKLYRDAEALECYETAVSIDPNEPLALSNLGMLKIKLAQYQDAIAIFSKALTCCTNEPDVIRAKVAAYCLYAKSLIAWNAGKIDETTKYLDEALDISKINNLSLANSINLILELRSSDKLMAETFNSEDFVELQSNSEKTFKAFKALYDRFADKPVSEEASEILYSKAICSEALYDALNAKISTDTLQEARAFLKKRRLFNSVIAVNALENFILYLQMALEQNKRLPDIPKDTEKFLLNQLKLTNLLGYDLSQKITIDNYANSPIKLKHPLSIIPIDFPGKKEEKIRVCCVQIKFEVALKNNKDEHGYVLEDKEVIKEKVFSALEFAKQNNVNIVCFPELSTTEEWVSDAKGKYGEMVLIFGSYYKNSYNTCPVIIEGKEHFVQKINPSPLERETTQGTGMRSGDSLKIFNTRFGKFVVLLCYDFSEDLHCITKNANPTVKDIDFIIIPELNDRNDIFEKIADAACIDLPCPYFVLVNASNKGKKKQGCSCVIGLEDRDVLSKYVKEGTKPSDETDYKLIEAKQGESLFIVDLDIKIKGIKFPVEPKMNVIGFYILNQAYNWIKI